MKYSIKYEIFLFLSSILYGILYFLNEYIFQLKVEMNIATILFVFLQALMSAIPNILDNRKEISNYGSYRLIQTIDRDSISNEIKKSLEEGIRFIYVDCSNLSKNNILNIKHKIYDDLTLFKRCENVRCPTSFSDEDFNKIIFESGSTCKKKYNVVIYDDEENFFTMQRIEEKLNELANNRSSKKCEKKKDKLRVIYLTKIPIANCNTNSSNSKIIRPTLTKDDYKNMYNKEDKSNTLEIDDLTNFEDAELTDVIIIENILKDNLYRIILSEDKELIVPIYFLQIGKYEKAYKFLSEKYKKQQNSRGLCYLYCDCLHLMNLYFEAVKIIKNENKKQDELTYYYNKLLAHIYKHLGKFSKSNKILNRITQNPNIYLERVIITNNYFMKLMQNIKKANIKELKIPQFKPGNYGARDMMTIGALTYQKDPEKSLLIINDCIDYFEEVNDRFIYNAYYIKAELLRRQYKYEMAYEYYLKASGIYDNHCDINLLDQCYFSMKSLELLGYIENSKSNLIKNYKSAHFIKGTYIKKKFKKFSKNVKKCDQRSLWFNSLLLELVDNNSTSLVKLKSILDEYLFLIL